MSAHRTLSAADLRVGHTVKVWWHPGHDTITAQTDDDPCTCATGGAYLCLRCERIAETQDIGF